MLAYFLVSTISAAFVGAMLSSVGQLIAPTLRLSVGTLTAAAAVVVGGMETMGSRLRLLQCDAETPKRWAHQDGWKWSLKNGCSLGIGAFSRIGFPAWYAIPASCFLMAAPAIGAAIFGIYGATRAFSGCAMFWIEDRLSVNLGQVWDRLLLGNNHVRRCMGGLLLALGVTFIAILGV